MHLKDRLDEYRSRNCIYKIDCQECQVEYIGQTARELSSRLAEHRRKSTKPPRNKLEYDTLVRSSAIAGHALDTGHAIAFDNCRIIRKNIKNQRERLYAEAIEIKKSQSAINRVEGVEISGIWRSVIKFAG